MRFSSRVQFKGIPAENTGRPIRPGDKFKAVFSSLSRVAANVLPGRASQLKRESWADMTEDEERSGGADRLAKVSQLGDGAPEQVLILRDAPTQDSRVARMQMASREGGASEEGSLRQSCRASVDRSNVQEQPGILNYFSWNPGLKLS